MWLAFLEKPLSTDAEIFPKDIPHDCEFIAVENITESTYKLTELYSVKDKQFSYDFGFWDGHQGWVNVTAIPFHLRRQNLNGTNFKTLVPQVRTEI